MHSNKEKQWFFQGQVAWGEKEIDFLLGTVQKGGEECVSNLEVC